MGKIFNYEPKLEQEDIESLNSCLQQGFASPSYINNLESELSSYYDSEVVCCASGTSALHLSLLACGIGPGDEVICPALTFSATWNSILYTGATPIFCDVKEDTWCIDVEKIEDLITDDTKAIMSVDLYGNPCDYDSIRKLCDKHGLYFVSDAAESLGSLYKGKPCTALADISAVSFNVNKIITGNGGGAVIINNPSLSATKVRNLINQNKIPGPKYEYYGVGYNYRMSSFSAAIISTQLNRICSILQSKKAIYDFYRDNLNPLVKFQKVTDLSTLNYWINIVQFTTVEEKNRVYDALHSKGIECKSIFSPGESLLNSNQIHQHCLALPSGLGLSQEQLEMIVQIVNNEL